MKKELKVIIIDNNSRFREGLRFFIDNHTNWIIIQEESSGIEFLQNGYTQLPDIILIDLNMPQINGTETIYQFFSKNASLPIKVIATTMHGDEFQLQKLIEVGFSGFVLKKDIYKYLHEAVEKVMQGGVYFHKYIKRNLIINT